MQIGDQLREEVYSHIDQVRHWEFDLFEKEEDFIDATVDTLDGFSEERFGQAIEMKAKKMHPTPKVDFNGPNWDDNPRSQRATDWINNTSAELADIMVILNVFVGDIVTNRRITVSQTKFSKEKKNNEWKWKIKMHQYYLLHELPEITFVVPATGGRFTLEPKNRSFTTYSFASDFHHAFFNTTEKMRNYMSSTQGIQSTTYDPTPDAPYGFQVFHGMLKRFVLGMYGEKFKIGDSIYELLEHIYEHNSFDRSVSSDVLSDGGRVDYNDSGMAIIQIDVGLENLEPNFDQIDEHGPRL